MTGYLARLAARVAGAGSPVTPRVPSRFEGYPPVESETQEVDPPALPGVHQAAVADPRQPVVTDLGPTRSVGHRGQPDVGSDSGPAAKPRVGWVAAPPSLAPTSGPRTAEAPVVPPTRPEPPGPEPTEPDDVDAVAPRTARAVPVPPPGDPEPPLPVQESPRSEARDDLTPALPVAAWPTTQTAETPRSTGEDTVVRISIGRVEVRAAVTPPARPARPRTTTGPEPLALRDYLRGRREA
jgi:hypothetical protein